MNWSRKLTPQEENDVNRLGQGKVSDLLETARAESRSAGVDNPSQGLGNYKLAEHIVRVRSYRRVTAIRRQRDDNSADAGDTMLGVLRSRDPNHNAR